MATLDPRNPLSQLKQLGQPGQPGQLGQLGQINQLKSALETALRGAQMHILGPIILASVIGIYYFGAQMRELVTAIQAATAAQVAIKSATAEVDKKPLPPAEVAKYQEVLRRLHPAVTIEVAGEGSSLTISVPDVRLYNEWMFALYSLQSYGKNVLWDASRVCLKECGNSAAAVAVVKGYVQSVRFK